MDTSFDCGQDNRITAQETPGSFWKLLDYPFVEEDWQEAGKNSLRILADLPVFKPGADLADITNAILSEQQFGSKHFRLKPIRNIYYSLVRPFFPEKARLWSKRLLKNYLLRNRILKWPIEDRYAHFQWDLIANLLKKKGLCSIPYVHFWPEGKRCALVITHDVEGTEGQRQVRKVADLEEKYGFRSAFNFVPEEYELDWDLIKELTERGFEIGVHGLKHDGKLLASKDAFLQHAIEINKYLKAWGAVGFRSPLTHRNPEWMQALDIEYDASFFDTDPFEPIPGGTMSIWPFLMGRFVELPYTLVQDHSLMVTLGERSPRLWLEKVNFIRRYCGMAMMISHPDYLRRSNHFAIYEDFLRTMRSQGDFWQALPMEVARWWRKRNALKITDGVLAGAETLPGLQIGKIRFLEDTIELLPDGT